MSRKILQQAHAQQMEEEAAADSSEGAARDSAGSAGSSEGAPPAGVPPPSSSSTAAYTETVLRRVSGSAAVSLLGMSARFVPSVPAAAARHRGHDTHHHLENVGVAHDAYAELADVDENLGNLGGAIHASRELLGIDPSDRGARSTLERLLGRAERWQDLATFCAETEDTGTPATENIASEVRSMLAWYSLRIRSS
jgi:hypothetical protein